MLQYLTPNMVFETIYDITPALLQKKGIRGVLIDIDGTVSSHRVALPSDELRTYVKGLQDAGIATLFLSNNKAMRVGTFSDSMGIRWISRAKKPLGRAFRQAIALLDLPAHEIAMIGDQIFTDVLGGNRAGMLTCQVQSLDRKEFWVAVRCRLERRFIARGRRNMKGED